MVLKSFSVLFARDWSESQTLCNHSALKIRLWCPRSDETSLPRIQVIFSRFEDSAFTNEYPVFYKGLCDLRVTHRGRHSEGF
jgi:hypothetical protein